MALCPGVGGLELGLELALGPAYQTVVYVERNPFVSGVLAARMQDGDLAPAPIWDDLTTFDGRPWRGRVDLISAGFPCQPFSQAGKGESTCDPRYLWDDVARVVGEVGPRFVFLENVSRLVSACFVPKDPSTRGEVFGQVLADLAALGYVGAWGCLRAADVGAPHRRDRVFVLGATPDALDWLREQHGREGWTRGQAAPGPRTDGARGCMANADRQRRHEGTGRPEPDSGGPAVPHADRGRREGLGLAELRGEQGPRGDQSYRRGGGGQWGPDGPWAYWEAEPDVGRVVDGVAAGVDLARTSRRSRLRATGNGCVPQQAAVAFRSLIDVIPTGAQKSHRALIGRHGGYIIHLGVGRSLRQPED